MKQFLPTWPKIYAIISLSSLLVFSVSTVVMHFVNMALGVRVPWYLSHFATGPTFWAWTVGLLGLAVGAATTARAMQLCLEPSRWRTAAVVLMSIMSVGAVAMAIFPSDEYNPFSVQSMIHIGFAIPTFVAMCASVVATSAACRRHDAWRRLGTAGLALALPVFIAVAVFIAAMTMEHPSVGAAERFIVYGVITWFALFAANAIRLTGTQPMAPRTA